MLGEGRSEHGECVSRTCIKKEYLGYAMWILHIMGVQEGL